jgi:hypothetical protein
MSTCARLVRWKPEETLNSGRMFVVPSPAPWMVTCRWVRLLLGPVQLHGGGDEERPGGQDDAPATGRVHGVVGGLDLHVVGGAVACVGGARQCLLRRAGRGRGDVDGGEAGGAGCSCRPGRSCGSGGSGGSGRALDDGHAAGRGDGGDAGEVDDGASGQAEGEGAPGCAAVEQVGDIGRCAAGRPAACLPRDSACDFGDHTAARVHTDCTSGMTRAAIGMRPSATPVTSLDTTTPIDARKATRAVMMPRSTAGSVQLMRFQDMVNS